MVRANAPGRRLSAMHITPIAVPFQLDMGRWGYALGPQAFLDHGLLAALCERGHAVAEPVWIDLPASERTRDSVTNLGRIAARTAAAVRACLSREHSLALVLEGDCSHAVGAIGGLSQAGGPPGVAWFDAHGDLNTLATSASGYWGGMPYAVALGWDLDDWRLAAGLEPPLRPEAAALFGTSDLDAPELAAIARHGIAHLTAEDIGQPEGAARTRAALRVRAHAAAQWYLHLDVDVAGPIEVPGGMTPAPTWPPRERIIAALAAAAGAVPVRVFALATYNPAGDPTSRGAQFGLDALLAAVDQIRA
jgi:arginase